MHLLGGIEVKKTHVEAENMMFSFLVDEFGTLFELQEDPRKGPHLPSFPTLLRMGGLFGVFFRLLFPLNLTRVKIFFCINQNI